MGLYKILNFFIEFIFLIIVKMKVNKIIFISKINFKSNEKRKKDNQLEKNKIKLEIDQLFQSRIILYENQMKKFLIKTRKKIKLFQNIFQLINNKKLEEIIF
jgi:hypothetical protein